MALIRVLAEDQLDELARAYRAARNRGEQWRQALTRGANRMAPDVKEMLERAIAQSEANARALTPVSTPLPRSYWQRAIALRERLLELG